MRQDLTYRGHLKAALALGLPLIGSHLAQFMVHVVDTLMLGWYGVQELAAVTLAGTFFFILFIMGSGFAWAVMPMVAAASEAGDDTRVRRVTRMGMWISVGVGIAVFPLLFFSAPILTAMGQDPELSEIAQQYLRIAGWGLFPALIVMVLKSYLAALERARVVLWTTLVAALLNGVLNYALIFGHWGAPELGVRGAAIASVVLQLVSMVALAIYAVRVLPQHGLFTRIWRPDWEALGEVARMGAQIGLTSLAEAGLFSASTVIMGWIGTLELAAHGIAIQIVSLFFMVHVGLSNAATVRAGRALGRGDELGLRRGAGTIIALSLVFALVAVVLFLAIPGPMMGVFLDPDEPLRDAILTVGASLLAVAALFQFADAAQVMALGLLRGVQDTRVPMVIAAVSYWIVGVPLSYAMGITWGWGGVGVWMGLVMGLLLAGILMMTRFWRKSSRIAG
ncbi:MATE family efflux transporter [Aliiroseovarius subalbicans]|uniref:MATE family efflux transporter n=1 Tax=Aliiroseovarius subalbicans TaxID=2925840 RepID=UPI001F57E15A|nr:MATE family efflux transporter [Aliiroseovarius subalbicans]MCI2397866.1 MATE family efflux transporter [Aliiroseovarius subalbicans]